MGFPKLYAPVLIRFWSLRNGVGDGLGVIFDIDTLVDRVCRRVRCADGWKWQIVDFDSLIEWDYFVDTDKDILDEYGSDVYFEMVEDR